MTGARFCRLLEAAGISFFTGVPDSTLAGAFAHLEGLPQRYVAAPREDLAVGVAVGAWLAGRLPAVLMQSSGLGTSMNALLSLAVLYRVPILVVVGWRGQGPDAPEHTHTGRTLPDVLRAIELPFVVVERDSAEADVAGGARRPEAEQSPVALLVPQGIIGC